MFNLNELAQVEDILQRSPSLTPYEVQMAMCELRDQGSCYVRDQGQIESHEGQRRAARGIDHRAGGRAHGRGDHAPAGCHGRL